MPSRYANFLCKVFALVLLFQSVRSLDKKRSDCIVQPVNSSDADVLTFPDPFILHPDRNRFDVNVTTDIVTAPQNLRIARYPQQRKFVLSWTWQANDHNDDYFGLRLFQNRTLICQRLIRSVRRQGLKTATYKANFFGMEASWYRLKIRAMTREATSRMKIISFRFETGEKLAEDERRKKSDEVAAASYTPDIIDQPLDVLFMVDRSSPLDADLMGSKCLLRNLTEHFQVAYYKKIRIALMSLDGDPGLEFDFRRYADQYGYQRGYEVLVGEEGVENYVGRALTYASGTLLTPNNLLGARQNVPKVIVALLGSESRDAVKSAAQEMLSDPYRVTVAVGYGNASVTDLQEITGGDVESVLFAENAQEMCQMWTQVHRVIVDRLSDLYSAPLNAPGGFTIGLYNQDVAEIGWQRPDDLVTSYSIRYRPSQMGNNAPTVEMVVDVGQERGVHLHNLDTTTYIVEVVAKGINQTSPPSRLVFDMSCAHMVMDAVIMFDTSRWTQNDLDVVRRQFLPRFIGGFLIGIKATRIGIAFYSDEVVYVAPLSTYDTRPALMARIPQIIYENGNRDTGAALNWAYLYGFEYARRNLPKVLVVVTDGKAEDDVTRGSQNLRSDQTIVIHIGVGKNTSEIEARKYISRPYIDHYMEVDSYENLTSIQFNLSRTICNKVFDQYKQSNTALSPPIDLQVDNVRNITFEVTWDAPIESSLIMGYVISDNTTGKNYSVGKNCRQFTFTDLSPGLGYNVSIRSKGLGADSAAEYVSTTTEVLPPYNPSAVQLSSRLLQIRWTSPSDEVVGHEIKIMIRDSLQVIQTINTGKPTRLINTNVILPGIEYKIEIRAIYDYKVISDAAVATVVTELPIPEDFRVEHVEEWEVKVAWKKLEIAQHKNSRTIDERYTKITYLVKVFNEKEEQVAHESYQPGDDNKLYQGKTEDGDLFMLVRNLLPGQQYNATLQAQLHEQLSKPLHTQFMTKRISIPLDVVIMFEISPTLHADDITMTQNFLLSLVDAFETSRDNSVRISATQLSNRPTEIFSMKQSSTANRNWVEKLRKLSPKAGTSILGTEHFSRVVSEKFKNARSGVARALILLMTNQHYSNLMPETEDELARKGITTIIIQMSHLTQEPYVNQSMMHRYVLDEFDKLYRSVNYVVTDIVRADEYPLARVSRERNLKPRKLTIKRNSRRQIYAHWQSPAEMPDFYLLRLKTAKASVWRRNVTSSRQSSYEYNLESDNPLRKDIKYTLVVEAVARDGFSSKNIITFRSNFTTSSRNNPSGRPTSGSHPGVGGGPTRKCCSSRRSQRLYIQRVFSRLREISKSAPSCLLSGSNVVFLVDSSDSTHPSQFNLLKTWMKRFVLQLKIEQQNRAAIERRKLAIKRRIAKRLPQILSYGVGISIVQYAQNPQVELELKTRITNVFINKYITKMERIGGSEANLGQALRFVDEKILGNVTTTKKLIRNINYVIVVSSSASPPSSDHFLQTSAALKKAGVKLISIGINNNLHERNSVATNPASALYNYQLESFNALEEIELYENVCKITRRLTPGIFENEEENCRPCRITPSPRPTIPQRPRKPSIGKPDEKRPQQPTRTYLRGARGPKGETGRAGPPGKACFVGAQSLLDLMRSENKTSTSNHNSQRCGPGFSTPNDFREALKGNKGDIGAAGPQGPKGMSGRMGLKGASGDTGRIGPQGPRGRPGPKGDPGINRNEMETIARSICSEMMQEQERRFRELLSAKKTITENRVENSQPTTSVSSVTITEAEAYTSIEASIPQDTTTSSSTSTHLQYDTTTTSISCANGICSTNSDDEDILEDSTNTSGEDKPDWVE